MRTEAGIFAWLGPVVLMVSALLTAGYLFPVIVEAFFPGRDWGKMDGVETCKLEPHRCGTGAVSVSPCMGVPLAVLGFSLLALGALGNPVFELLRGIASGMV